MTYLLALLAWCHCKVVPVVVLFPAIILLILSKACIKLQSILESSECDIFCTLNTHEASEAQIHYWMTPQFLLAQAYFQVHLQTPDFLKHNVFQVLGASLHSFSWPLCPG